MIRPDGLARLAPDHPVGLAHLIAALREQCLQLDTVGARQQRQLDLLLDDHFAGDVANLQAHERRLIGYRSATEYRDVHKLALLAAAGATLLVLIKL